MRNPLVRFTVLAGIALTAACGASAPRSTTPIDLAALRSEAKSSRDGEVVGRWLLDEMLAPGGTAEGARAARTRFQRREVSSSGMTGALATALYDDVHGSPKTAARGYLDAIRAARANADPSVPLVAWLASHRLIGLRGSVAGLYTSIRRDLLPVLDHPGAIGWRAVAELTEWSTAEESDAPGANGDSLDNVVVERLGCAKEMRIAGPFGHGTSAERRRSFPAEQSPWPSYWPEDDWRGTVPHILKTERHRCLTAGTEHVSDGVFYAETFFDLAAARDLIVAVRASTAVWIDDVPVLDRDLRDWGSWQRFGAAVHLEPGRHRLLARILSDDASARLLNLDGTAAHLATDTDARKPYGLTKPLVLTDPNPIHAIVSRIAVHSRPGRVRESNGTAPGDGTALMGLLAAHAAYADGLNDVAAALLEPFVTPKKAGPVALEFAARFAAGDVAYPEQMRRIREKDLLGRASAIDKSLWHARAWLILDDASQRGVVEAVEPLRALVAELPEVPDLALQLARVYEQLGWRAERLRTLEDLAGKFPDNRDVLRFYLSALDDDGTVQMADAIAERLRKLDPDSEVDLERALARRDWKAAVAELKRLQKRRPDRKDIAERIADVLQRAGDPSAAAKQLQAALAKNPDDAEVRLRLADFSYAKGDTSALRRALAESISAGSKGNAIRNALELLEGASLLAPYRMDGLKIIREFERWEKTGKRMDGNAARILDYAATWVHPDGSSEMLEHEILRMQSQEAIGQEAEQKPPEGLVLHLRVIKPDGSVLEPEPVEGKPTLTMPHLEQGDYLEIEHIVGLPSDGSKGKRYRGPHWFFREPDKGYWRSEFVVLLPKDKPIEIETVGNVPPPKVSDKATFVERRWRIDDSPPAPDEPESPNPREFLPSVRVGWGITLDDMLVRYVDSATDETPLDPRLLKIVDDAVKGIPEGKLEARAQALYKFIGDQVQEGDEGDGRRVLTGRAGSRQAAFAYLMRLSGIPFELAIVKSRIAMPPKGKMSEVEVYDNVVARIETEHGVRWLTLRDKFAPFGYVPAELRGQPAIRLVAGTPREQTPEQGAADGVTVEGHLDLHANGSATLEITQSFSGRMGIGLRGVFDRVAEGKRDEFVETRILAPNVPGARLQQLSIENAEDLDAPFVLRIRAEAPNLARPQGKRLAIKSIFPAHLGQIASLAKRQTPLLLGGASHVEVRIEIRLNPELHAPNDVSSKTLRDQDRSVIVQDRVEGASIFLDRKVDIPAGRVQPGPEYDAFVRFTQAADELLEREVVVSTGR